MPENRAAFLVSSKPQPLEVRDAPFPVPEPNQLVVRTRAIAINPADYLKQSLGGLLYNWVKYPFILGTDVAGVVHSVGSSVTRFKPGDRILGNAVGVDEKINSSAHATFQNYVVLFEDMTSPIPDDLSFEAASVVPLGLSTASCGLFQEDQLHLALPTVGAQAKSETILIWGGSTSVGSNAIQLARAAGYEVITTSSPRNFEYVKSLGAKLAFDYNSSSVVDDILAALQDKVCAGALSIGPGGAEKCLSIISQAKGRKFVSMASYPVPNPLPKRFVMPKMVMNFVAFQGNTWLKYTRKGVNSKFIFGTTLVHNGVGKAIYEGYLPQALSEHGQNKFLCKPDPIIVGKKLEDLQSAMDKLRDEGVSAGKLVVTVEEP